MTREERAERVLGLLDNRPFQPFRRSVNARTGARSPSSPEKPPNPVQEGENPRPFASFPGSPTDAPRMRDRLGNAIEIGLPPGNGPGVLSRNELRERIPEGIVDSALAAIVARIPIGPK